MVPFLSFTSHARKEVIQICHRKIKRRIDGESREQSTTRAILLMVASPTRRWKVRRLLLMNFYATVRARWKLCP